jgi:hypothetical protein
MAKKDEAPQQLQEPEFAAPIEIEFHIAGVNTEKYQTPDGGLTILNLISPIGIAVTVKLSDENVDQLIKDLQGSKVDVFKSLPGLVQ